MLHISLNDVISQLSVALDAVEADLLGATRFHGKRTALFCLEIGKYMGYDRNQLFNLAGCALLHDNALTEYILSEHPNVSQGLNLRTHCVIGQKNAEYFPFPGDMGGFILYHHENADGSGAFGKKADEYPEEAGIIALADQIDVKFALQRTKSNQLAAIHEFIKKETGKKYAPNIAKAAAAVLNDEFLRIVQNEVIEDTVKSEIPEVMENLTDDAIVYISGIIAKIIDYKSEFTKEHSIQIANKAWLMGHYYGYSSELCSKVYLAAALHDIGKLFIPSFILEKPGKLTEEEFQTIKSHGRYTWDLLHDIRGFDEIAVWASCHHEKLDGSGYPFGYKELELDFNSRLLTCLDIYQAVREKRPYHPVRSHQDTMKILYDMAGKGLIDAGITRDLDQAFSSLTEGYAPPPKPLLPGEEK